MRLAVRSMNLVERRYHGRSRHSCRRFRAGADRRAGRPRSGRNSRRGAPRHADVQQHQIRAGPPAASPLRNSLHDRDAQALLVDLGHAARHAARAPCRRRRRGGRCCTRRRRVAAAKTGIAMLMSGRCVPPATCGSLAMKMSPSLNVVADTRREMRIRPSIEARWIGSDCLGLGDQPALRSQIAVE